LWFRIRRLLQFLPNLCLSVFESTFFLRQYLSVVNGSPTGLDLHLKKGYYLTLILEVSSPILWMSPYSQNQQILFDLTRSKDEDIEELQ